MPCLWWGIFYRYILGGVSFFSFLRMFLGESPKNFLQKLEKCERDSNPCSKQISEMEASVFFVNYNLGEGPWERYPQPLTWDAEGIQYLDAFSQCIETNVDDTVLYESANILSPDGSGIDVRFGTLPLTYALYEAENANLTNVQTIECYDSSGGYEVGYINYSDSKVLFDKVVVPESGTYTVYVRYNNGTGGNSSHKVSVNGGSSSTVTYPATADWNRYQWASFNCPLNAGNNTIQLSFNGTYAELDCIMVGKAGTDLNRDFMIKNKNSKAEN